MTRFEKQPHHAGQKSVAPVRPRGLVVLPFSVVGVKRIKAGMIGNEPADLLLRERKRIAQALVEIFIRIFYPGLQGAAV